MRYYVSILPNILPPIIPPEDWGKPTNSPTLECVGPLYFVKADGESYSNSALMTPLTCNVSPGRKRI